jgi:hypothetical protein
LFSLFHYSASNMKIKTEDEEVALLSCVSEFPHLPAAKVQTVMAVAAKFRSPGLDHSQQGARLPVRLCAVIDTSASMAGLKLSLVKAVTTFTAQQLTAHDSFALISYDTQVGGCLQSMQPENSEPTTSADGLVAIMQAAELMPLSSMTERQQGYAEHAISCMTADGGATNISSGLTKGMMVLKESPPQLCKSEPTGTHSLTCWFHLR